MRQAESFRIRKTDGKARKGIISTRKGLVQTPVFMPVGTAGSVKSLCPADLSQIGTEMILANTYHLYLRPGDGLLAEMGGVQEFSAWSQPVLTDSGGYQVFSLAALRELSDEGVVFSSHLDGSRHLFTPEGVMDIQANIGSDIWMVLDHCVPYQADMEQTEEACRRTTHWAQRSLEAFPRGGNLVFGIVQGGFFYRLREKSAREICSLPFDGFAIGGLSVGEPKEVMRDILSRTAPRLPWTMPRYLMGVGKPVDILQGIREGMDMFDCVLPTRNARNGTLYTSQGKINIKQQRFRQDPQPLDPQCSCYTCRTFSRAYLRHLYISRELLSYRLNTLHNLAFYQEMIRGAREAIERGRTEEYIADFERIFPEDTL